jgi:zinc protease
MKKQITLSFLFFVTWFTGLTQTQNNVLPLDKNVKMGKLPNGLTYYIRKNSKPENRVELRLVVNAGSVQEREDQRGVAHFLEHMAFNGTKNFPKDQLLNYLQKSGVRFGADLNATTSFNYTYYILPIPSNDEQLLQNGYKVLRDWAGNMLLEADEIEKERGIILEEKRMRQDANMRMFAQYLPSLTNNSRYGERIPIGKEEVIKTAPRKAFADFYTSWYRPNNMALIAVGDIDVAKTEATIKALFSDLKNPSKAPARSKTPVTWHTSSKAQIVCDAENTNNILYVYFGLQPAKRNNTVTAYNESLLNQLITELFGGRLQDNFVNPKSPISFANINLSEPFLIFKDYTTASAAALVKDDPAAALTLLVGEILKAQQFGFTQDELDRVKKNTLKSYEEAVLEKDKTESANYVNEYFEHFLNGTPSPGIEAEQQMVVKFINSLTLEQINNQVKKFNINQPSYILFNCKDASKNSGGENNLLAAFEKAKQQKVEAYTEKKVSDRLMDVMPKAGSVLKTESNDDYQSKTLTLSNGIKVLYKKTSFKNDEIVFRAAQWGGQTNLTPAEIQISKFLSLVNSMGLGKNKAADMPKILTGVEANAFFNLTQTQLTMAGNASAKDFEKLLQIIHLRLTNVNFDADEFEGIKSSYTSQISGLLKNPAFRFIDTINRFKFNNSGRITLIPTEAEAKQVQMKELQALYAKVMANLNGMVMSFSGNIDETSFINLIEKYIASIPTQSAPVTLNTQNIVNAVSGKNAFTIKAGKENKSEINYSYYGKTMEMNDTEVLSFLLLGEILQIQANRKLREEMASTYSPKVSNLIVRPPLSDINIGLSVSSLPENVDKITAAFDDLINAVIKGELSDDDLLKAKAQRIKTMENFLKTNSFWASTLEQQANYGYNPKVATEYQTRTEAITKDDVIKAARKFLKTANTLKAVMNPE